MKDLWKRMTLAYWNEYYEYGKLYGFWFYLFPVAGRRSTNYLGDERLFRPFLYLRHRSAEIQIVWRTYCAYRKIHGLSPRQSLDKALAEAQKYC